MKAYYNEIDSFCCQWLRNLIDAELIPAGHIDQRSIKDVTPDDLAGYTQCHFFAGIAGWAEALRIAEWPVDAPVWSGSCPCQPFSAAGKRKGTADERHLWPEFYRLIAQCGPAIVFGEQVAGKDGLRWLDGVFTDLEGIDYACGATDLPAASAGAAHKRQRLFWVADAGHDMRTWARQGRRLEASERSEPGIDAESGGVAIRLADAAGLHGPEHEREPREGSRGTAGPENSAERGGAGHRLEYAESDGRIEGRAQPNGRLVASGRGTIVIPCRDGKARRISAQPGDEPLAYAIPVSLGRGRTKLERMAIRAARANRTGRIRGYGNAIVPQVAAEFIRAFMES